ncbi:hypothetical protein DA075_35505 (plasmid) [Methylobacterium currus]|uniref:Uncharacterized protein n=1 Tax=Methylobacterium currus TaxID=2051553 RepID=A0A2R4WXD2_9HYPH|nr:hypothetical protein [Methylobacterium currus]AWB26180.1 hypothetical protein DA075_35505 [Methylobacterium currus]
MTSVPRHPAPSTAPAQDRRHQAVPAYALHAPTLPPDEAVPGEIEPWEAVSAVRPDTAFVRAARFLNASGDVLAAIVLIGGGMGLIGLATHL